MAIDTQSVGSVDGVVMISVYVAGELLMGFSCEHAARHAATKLAEAREAGPRGGMKILTDHFGMCDDAAQHVLELLTGASINLN